MELISEHNELQAAFSSALSVMECKASEVKAMRKGRTTVEKEGEVIVITPAVIEFTCTVSQFTGVTLSWTIPTTRADGSLLPFEEIKGYELDINGTMYNASAAAKGLQVPGVKAGQAKIRTVDTDGLISEWSAVVEF